MKTQGEFNPQGTSLLPHARQWKHSTYLRTWATVFGPYHWPMDLPSPTPICAAGNRYTLATHTRPDHPNAPSPDLWWHVVPGDTSQEGLDSTLPSLQTEGCPNKIGGGVRGQTRSRGLSFTMNLEKKGK